MEKNIFEKDSKKNIVKITNYKMKKRRSSTLRKNYYVGKGSFAKCNGCHVNVDNLIIETIIVDN